MMHLSLLCCRVVLVLVAAASFAAAAPQKPRRAPKPPTNEDCLMCHGDAAAARADGRSVAVDPEVRGLDSRPVGDRVRRLPCRPGGANRVARTPSG